MNWWLPLMALIAASGVTRPAGAHAPPRANGVGWFKIGGVERALVRTNRGLILEDPGGGSFRIVCNDAFEAALAEVPPVAIASDGRLLLGTYTGGLVISSPDRCNFESVAGAFTGFYPIDLKSNEQGSAFFAAVLARDGSSSELLQSADHGRTAQSLAALPGAPSALEIAPSDESRLYISTTTTEGNLSFGHVLGSRDGGQSFVERPVELDASELRVFLLAIDPNDPDRLFVRTQSRNGVTPERLLRSEDGGDTFETVLSAPGPLSAVVHPDSSVWAAGAEGLYRSGDGGHSFVRLEHIDLGLVSCLTVHAESIYVCGFSAGEFGVMRSTDAGATFGWFLRFPQVTARLDCAADSDEGTRCETAFADWREEQGPFPASGGAGGAGGGSATHSGAMGDEGGCQLSRQAPRQRSFMALGIAFALAAALRFRRAASANA
jgi:hypothetical protein